MAVPVEEFVKPTLDELESKALKAMRDNPKVWKAYNKKERLEIASKRAKSCQDYAERLGGGVQAYQTAIRMEILGVESD